MVTGTAGGNSEEGVHGFDSFDSLIIINKLYNLAQS